MVDAGGARLMRWAAANLRSIGSIVVILARMGIGRAPEIRSGFVPARYDRRHRNACRSDERRVLPLDLALSLYRAFAGLALAALVGVTARHRDGAKQLAVLAVRSIDCARLSVAENRFHSNFSFCGSGFDSFFEDPAGRICLRIPNHHCGLSRRKLCQPHCHLVGALNGEFSPPPHAARHLAGLLPAHFRGTPRVAVPVARSSRTICSRATSCCAKRRCAKARPRRT